MYVRILSLILSIIITLIVVFYSFVFFGTIIVIFVALFFIILIYTKIKNKVSPPINEDYTKKDTVIIDVTPENNDS